MIDFHCLDQRQTNIFFDDLLRGNKHVDEFLEEIKLRSSTYWDLMILSNNCFISIYTEQLMRQEDLTDSFISSLYEIRNQMYLEIAEIDYTFINFLFENKIPTSRNKLLDEIESAKKYNNQEQLDRLRESLKSDFEEDLTNNLTEYESKKIHN